MDYEVTLLQVPQCFVYRIPPASSAAGYKAKDWDLSNPIWQGRLVVTTLKGMCIVRLVNADGTEFAICPVNNSKAVEKVLDSSRYFAIRISDGSGKTAVIGLGFAERNTAFDFSASLQDQQKKVQQEKEIAAARSRRAQEPAVDYSLPQGKTISIGLKMKTPKSAAARPSRRRAAADDDDDDDGDEFFIAPPPAAHTSSPVATKSTGPNLLSLESPAPADPKLIAPGDSLFEIPTQSAHPLAPGPSSLAPSPFPTASPYGGPVATPSPFGGLTAAPTAASPFGLTPSPATGAPSLFGGPTPSASPSPFGLTPTPVASPSPFGIGGPAAASPSPFGASPFGIGGPAAAAPSPFGIGGPAAASPFGIGGPATAPSPFGIGGPAAASPFGIGGPAAASPSPFGIGAPFGASSPAPSSNAFGLF